MSGTQTVFIFIREQTLSHSLFVSYSILYMTKSQMFIENTSIPAFLFYLLVVFVLSW